LSTHANLVNLPIPNHNNVATDECWSALDDALLVSAARAGHHSAFVELYERHSRKVLPRIYRITKNREDAEDAFQDAVLRAFLHIKGFEGRSNFTSWLTRIATNSALMVLRKRRGGAEISIEQMCDDSDNSRAWEPPDYSETPEACYARRESEELLRNAIQRLPCIFRDAVELQHAQEYSSGQVAEELGISLSAAKSRLMRARRTLGRRLSGTRPRKASKPGSPREASPSRVKSKAASTPTVASRVS
jgi:RNA polymerase sigma-70 factor (ECF subfamily)